MSGAAVPVKLPAHAAPFTQRFTGQYPVRFDGAPRGPFEGDTRWRGVREFDHAHLCRVFGLDPARFWFDLPSSCRGIGSNAAGAGGSRGRRVINGFVMMAGRDEPIAKLTICFDSERFRDGDPFDPSDFFDLNHS